jgi:uncharacterized membrane protein YdjX (TVP38/TMEM64 family)
MTLRRPSAGAALAAGLVLGGVALWASGLRISDATDAVRDGGVGAVALFVAVYVGATALLVPASALTLLAGAVWGPWFGFAIVAPTSWLAASVAFLAGRTVARAHERRGRPSTRRHGRRIRSLHDLSSRR